MATYHSPSIFLLLLFSLCISTSRGLEVVKAQRTQQKHVRKLDQTITNPANFPPYTPTPTIVTVPGTNPTPPVDPTTTTPTTTVPTTTTPTQPITNPPVVYPVNQPTPTTNVPITQGQGPTPTTNAPVTQGQGQGQGQSWCIAKSGAPESSLQDALDYACGIGGADCSMIQQGGSCYNPNSLENHASFAFNSYFQKNPSPTGCDFGGTAVLVTTNPSSGSCIYPSSATPAAMPLTTNPPTTVTPSSTIPTTTPSPVTTGSPPYGTLPAGTNGSPPSLSNPSNPNSLFPASYGPDRPPTSTTLPAGSAVLRPSFDLIILVALFFTGKLLGI